jgi:hypothetical protein
MSHTTLTRSAAKQRVGKGRVIRSPFEALLLFIVLLPAASAFLAMYVNGPWVHDLLRSDSTAWLIWDLHEVARRGGYVPTFLLLWASGLVALTAGLGVRHFVNRK